MTKESEAATKAFREKARLEREAQLGDDGYEPQFTTSTSYPGWECNNCHREFPPTTKVVKCPGKPGHGDLPAQPCGGILIRWQKYEEKTG